VSAFFEDVFSATERLKIVLAGRFDSLDLDRRNLLDGVPQASGFERRFEGINWRLGLVQTLGSGFTGYASYSTGEAPVGNNIFLVNSGEDFKLSTARQFETGLKYSRQDGRADLTAALYDIQRKNLLTQINNLGDVSNVGSQNSRGFELSGNVAPTGNWNLSANLAYTHARYGEFVDPNYSIDASGNETPNAPTWVANLWTSVRNIAGTGLELGAAVRFVGERYGDSGNALGLADYTLVDLHANYRLNRNLLITSRVNNVFDKAYAQWADIFYPTEVLLGTPRRFEIGLVGSF
jgi:iron complex outermembrane receptor protein